MSDPASQPMTSSNDLDAADTDLAAPPTSRGQRARGRLLAEALRLFAERGYEGTSTRDICSAAGSNVAAIHYHFGGKASLYREVFTQPVRALVAAASQEFGAAVQCQPAEGASAASAPPPRFDESMRLFSSGMRRIYSAYLMPLREPTQTSILALRLYLREMAEPTGLIDASMIGVAQMHQSAVHRLLSMVYGVPVEQLDEELRGLGVALSGLATNLLLYAGRINALNSGLLDTPQSVDRTLDRIVRYAELLATDEWTRRNRPARGGGA